MRWAVHFGPLPKKRPTAPSNTDNENQLCGPMRKAVIIGASVLVIGMCLFPPYTVKARYPASGETKTETQYAAVWEGPQDRGQYRLVDESSIDTAWLGIQLAIVVACGVVGVVAVPEE